MSVGRRGASSFDVPHPGVRDPRSRPRGEWSSLTDGLITGCLGLLVFLCFWAAATESPVGRVDAWATHRDAASRFTIEYPAGWTTTTHQGRGIAATRIGRSQNIYVEIVSQPTRSEQRVLLGAGSVVYAVLRTWHQSEESYLRLRFPDYRPGRPERTALGGRPAVWSRFTARQNSGELTGYHTTLLSRDRILLMVAVAPSDAWEDFKPIALHMLRSLRFGSSPARRLDH